MSAAGWVRIFGRARAATVMLKSVFDPKRSFKPPEGGASVRGISFVASLYVGALCCLVGAGIELYSKYQFWSDGESAVVETSDPVVQRYVKYHQTGLTSLDVTFVTPSGRIDVPDKIFSQDDVQRLATGQPIHIRFLKNNPRRTLPEDSPIPVPWGLLIGGILLSGVAAFAHSLLRKEARPASA